MNKDEDDGNIWFRLNQNTEIKDLYGFICGYLSFNKVMELYRMLEYDIKFNQNFDEN